MTDDLSLDSTAGSQEEVIAASMAGVTREFDRIKEAEKARRKQQWVQNPVRSFFAKVALPSTLIGLAAYGLSVSEGDPNALMAAASGALWYPIHTVREPVSRFFGKVDGAIKNLRSSFNKNTTETYFQQKTQEIRYEGWSDGAATVALATGAVLLPTYGDLIMNGATTVYQAGSYLYDVVTEGVRAVNTQAPTPK